MVWLFFSRIYYAYTLLYRIVGGRTQFGLYTVAKFKPSIQDLSRRIRCKPNMTNHQYIYIKVKTSLWRENKSFEKITLSSAAINNAILYGHVIVLKYSRSKWKKIINKTLVYYRLVVYNMHIPYPPRRQDLPPLLLCIYIIYIIL